MLLSISMRTRDGRAYAEALYSENKTIVKAGGKIHPTFNGQKSVKSIRDNEKIVDKEGNILSDVEFSSPSAAAQFVNGNISNGLRVWKIDGMPLGQFLKNRA